MTSRWRHLRVPRSRCILAVLILAGCASSMQNTPQQDYIYEMARGCSNIPNVHLDRVEPDGRYWIKSEPRMEYQFFDCMRAQFKAHPYFDWAKAQKRATTQAPAAVGSASPAVAGTFGPIMAPVWKIGDEWQYAYKSPTDSGTYVWSVNRVELLDGVDHYVIKSGTREIFYRMADLASSLERVDGVVVVRDTPSRLVYVWPLTVGKTWEQSNRYDRPVDRTTLDRNSIWAVEAEETITVLAGTFRTMKISWKNKNTGALNYEMWFAPDVKQWVKIREILSNGQRERELVSFKVK